MVLECAPRGEVAEWSNAPDSKSGMRVSRIEGSNPSLSAKNMYSTIQARPLNPRNCGFFIAYSYNPA